MVDTILYSSLIGCYRTIIISDWLTGHGLKPLDVEVMKKIHKKVNIIPVIGKADSCTVKEVNMFKTKVRKKPEVNVKIFKRNWSSPLFFLISQLS